MITRRAAPVLLALVLASCTAATPPAVPTASQGARPATSPAASATPKPLVMALAPTREVAIRTALGRVIALALSKATGQTWNVTVPATYAEAVDGLCSGTIDIAWLEPLPYVLAERKNCADLLLAQARNDSGGALRTTHEGQILVRSDSGIHTLADLKGKSIAFVDPTSLSGRLFPMLEVKRDTGQDPATFFTRSVTAGSQDLAVLAVYQGSVDSAASIVDARAALEKRFPDIMRRTTPVVRIGGIPNGTVVTRKGLAADLRAKIQSALLAYAATDVGKKILKELYGIDGLATAAPKAYDGVAQAATLANVDLEKAAAATPTAAPAATP